MIVKLYIYGRILSPIQMLIRLKSLSFLFTKSIDYTVRFATVYYSECVPFETAAAEAAPVPVRLTKQSTRDKRIETFCLFYIRNVSAREATQPEDFIDRPTLL